MPVNLLRLRVAIHQKGHHFRRIKSSPRVEKFNADSFEVAEERNDSRKQRMAQFGTAPASRHCLDLMNAFNVSTM